jgi:pimeloyl-ACP methyl ester carboxylesterase/class 3 adenylate cyclase
VAATAPDTRYAVTADGVHIAYQVHGEGPGDIVWIPGFASCFEVELENPQLARMIEVMSERWRVILFDKRGSGLSDRTYTPDLEMRADDLRAVLDAVGSSSAILVGQGEGGALAAFFAASHPDRVAALVPMYSWARIAFAADYPIGMPRDAMDADLRAIAASWGTVEYARTWAQAEIPSRAGDEAFLRWMAKALRHAASPAAAIEFQEIWYATDVRGVLGSIQTPTLVMTGEEFTGAAEGADASAMTRYLADHIPGARMHMLPGADFIPFGGDPTAFVHAIAEFVDDHRAEQAEFDRVLATVLFTDLVGSTARAAQLGDRAWKSVLERHHQVIRAMLGRYRGDEVTTTGDGFVATFDGPGRAVRCGQAIVAAMRPLGIEVRAGVHTGEIERMGDNVGGLAVHVGARIGSVAGPSEVVVSRTVRDLVSGSELEFEDIGWHDLKGLPEPWHLFRAAATA